MPLLTNICIISRRFWCNLATVTASCDLRSTQKLLQSSIKQHRGATLNSEPATFAALILNLAKHSSVPAYFQLANLTVGRTGHRKTVMNRPTHLDIGFLFFHSHPILYVYILPPPHPTLPLPSPSCHSHPPQGWRPRRWS